MKKQYMDVLKGIACIIVVFLHCPLPGLLGDGIIYGLRFSVPVFFMVSGYFSYSKEGAWILSKAIYILKLVLFSELFYGIWTVINQCLLQRNTFAEVMNEKLWNKNILQIIFSGTIFNGTLWYLYAMFWTWIFIYLIRRLGILQKAYILIPILLCVQIFGRAYVQNTFDINQYVFWFRNALTFGIPFTLLGMWIAEHEKSLLQKISIKNNLLIILGGFGLIVVEFLTLGQYMDLHVSTVFIAFGLFVLAIRLTGKVPKCFTIFLWIGSRWYLWVYLLQMFVLDIVNIVALKLRITDSMLFGYALPFVVCIVSCICSIVPVRIKKHFER